MKINELFDLSKTAASELLASCGYPHEILAQISSYVQKLGSCIDKNKYSEISEGVWAAKSAQIAPNANISAPCIIGENSEIRQCAFIRGAVLIGNGCVIGNSSEVKNSILFDNVQIPHFNYIGDSILGYRVHFGAGAITSNVKSDNSDVFVTYDVERKNSGRRKLGAFVGDFCEIGCGAVLCPGTLIGRNTTVYPLSLVRGAIPSCSVFKDQNNIIAKY